MAARVDFITSFSMLNFDKHVVKCPAQNIHVEHNNISNISLSLSLSLTHTHTHKDYVLYIYTSPKNLYITTMI